MQDPTSCKSMPIVRLWTAWAHRAVEYGGTNSHTKTALCMKVSKIGRTTARPIKGHFQPSTAWQCHAKGINMNAMNNAAATVNVNGIAASNWQKHAAAMIGNSIKASYAACQFIQAMINNASCNADAAALDWCRRAASSKAPITRNVAKRCLKIAAAALYGTVRSEKAGYTIPSTMPEVGEWTIDTLQVAVKTGCWKTRAGELLSMWNGKTPIRVEKAVAQKTAQERLDALAKMVARLMVKENFTMQQVEDAIKEAKAAALAK